MAPAAWHRSHSKTPSPMTAEILRQTMGWPGSMHGHWSTSTDVVQVCSKALPQTGALDKVVRLCVVPGYRGKIAQYGCNFKRCPLMTMLNRCGSLNGQTLRASLSGWSMQPLTIDTGKLHGRAKLREFELVAMINSHDAAAEEVGNKHKTSPFPTTLATVSELLSELSTCGSLLC